MTTDYWLDIFELPVRSWEFSLWMLPPQYEWVLQCDHLPQRNTSINTLKMLRLPSTVVFPGGSITPVPLAVSAAWWYLIPLPTMEWTLLMISPAAAHEEKTEWGRRHWIQTIWRAVSYQSWYLIKVDGLKYLWRSASGADSGRGEGLGWWVREIWRESMRELQHEVLLYSIQGMH